MHTKNKCAGQSVYPHSLVKAFANTILSTWAGCSLQPCGYLLGKGWPLGCRVRCVFLCFVTFPNVSWSTSELRMRLATWNWLKPSSKIFLMTVSRRYFFSGSFMLFLSCVCHAFASVHCCLVVTCWERADLLALVCDVYLWFCHFPMWYPWSGVVLDCIDSWSLSSFLLCLGLSRFSCV